MTLMINLQLSILYWHISERCVFLYTIKLFVHLVNKSMVNNIIHLISMLTPVF